MYSCSSNSAYRCSILMRVIILKIVRENTFTNKTPKCLRSLRISCDRSLSTFRPRRQWWSRNLLLIYCPRDRTTPQSHMCLYFTHAQLIIMLIIIIMLLGSVKRCATKANGLERETRPRDENQWKNKNNQIIYTYLLHTFAYSRNRYVLIAATVVFG